MDALRLADEPDQPGNELPALPEWREFAACADEPAETFFDESAESVAEAKRICEGCVVAGECRAEALSAPWLVGMFGGLTEDERRELRAGREPADRGRERRDTAAVRTSGRDASGRKPCGTSAACARHLRRGESACDACLEAQRLKSAEAHAKRRERTQAAGEGQDVPRGRLSPTA